MVVALVIKGGLGDTHPTHDSFSWRDSAVERQSEPESYSYASIIDFITFHGRLLTQEAAERGGLPTVEALTKTPQTGNLTAPQSATTQEAPAPSATPPPRSVATVGDIAGYATHYGESYNGSPLGCGFGPYSSANPTIVAVGPARAGSMPCGTSIQVCGPAGCIVAMRQDSCPGCSAYVLDLSEAGNAAVCGAPAHTCDITFRALN